MCKIIGMGFKCSYYKKFGNIHNRYLAIFTTRDGLIFY